MVLHVSDMLDLISFVEHRHNYLLFQSRSSEGTRRRAGFSSLKNMFSWSCSLSFCDLYYIELMCSCHVYSILLDMKARLCPLSPFLMHMFLHTNTSFKKKRKCWQDNLRLLSQAEGIAEIENMWCCIAVFVSMVASELVFSCGRVFSAFKMLFVFSFIHWI